MHKPNFDPNTKILRQFGFIALVAFGVLAVCAWLERGPFSVSLGDARLPLTLALILLGIVSASFSIMNPRANRPLYLGLTIATYPLAIVMSYLALGVLFFAIILPTGFFLRVWGRDPMNRGFSRDAQSYWRPAPPRKAIESYFRQS